jgi:dolichyl-phosphate mannosyltransferase polypeptide 2 regulatory subunit
MDSAHGNGLQDPTHLPVPPADPSQPFVDDDHALHSLFPPRVWAIRIPVILILLGTALVGSFLSMVMIRSNRKKAVKAKQAKKA